MKLKGGVFNTIPSPFMTKTYIKGASWLDRDLQAVPVGYDVCSSRQTSKYHRIKYIFSVLKSKNLARKAILANSAILS